MEAQQRLSQSYLTLLFGSLTLAAAVCRRNAAAAARAVVAADWLYYTTCRTALSHHVSYHEAMQAR
jgi:hypothetical protein